MTQAFREIPYGHNKSIPPLKIKILLEPIPPKSRIFVRIILAVRPLGTRAGGLGIGWLVFLGVLVAFLGISVCTSWYPGMHIFRFLGFSRLCLLEALDTSGTVNLWGGPSGFRGMQVYKGAYRDMYIYVYIYIYMYIFIYLYIH